MFDLTRRYHFLGVAILFEGGLVAVAWALGWWFDIDPLARLAWEKEGLAWGLAGTLPMIGLFLLGSRFPVGPLRKIKQFLEVALGSSLVACRWYDLLLVAAVAGIGEELLFRGVLHPLAGPIWSNVLFGLAHFITPAYALMAGLLGAYLGWLLDATQDLAAPIITHGLYDFLAFLVVARDCRRRNPGHATLPLPFDF